jgi:hypothetical protein
VVQQAHVAHLVTDPSPISLTFMQPPNAISASSKTRLRIFLQRPVTKTGE